MARWRGVWALQRTEERSGGSSARHAREAGAASTPQGGQEVGRGRDGQQGQRYLLQRLQVDPPNFFYHPL